MDLATIERLVEEYPESYRGGRVDRDRPLGRLVSVAQAWAKAERNLADEYGEGAAYWAGFAGHVADTDPPPIFHLHSL